MLEYILNTPALLLKIILFCALFFALFMAVIPSESDPTGFINDKFKHTLVFIFLAFLLDYSYPEYNKTLWKPIALFSYGLLIEFCQRLTPYREFSIGDLIANTVGIMTYFWAIAPLIR